MEKSLSLALKFLMFFVADLVFLVSCFSLTSFAETDTPISRKDTSERTIKGNIHVAEMLTAQESSGEDFSEQKTQTESKEVSEDNEGGLW